MRPSRWLDASPGQSRKYPKLRLPGSLQAFSSVWARANILDPSVEVVISRRSIMIRAIFLSLLLSTGFLALSACDEGPAENAGERIDEATSNVREGVEDAGDAIGDAADDAGDAISDAADEAKDRVDDAVN
jgi:hypothetical protein